MRLAGYAIVFNQLSQDMGGWKERIAPSAIRRTFNDSGDVVALYAHDMQNLLGRVSSGTLKLDVDKTGLHVVIEAPDTTVGRDVVKLMNRSDLGKMSFGFIPVASVWTLERGTAICTVTDLLLYEVSVVALPAYDATGIFPVNDRAANLARHVELQKYTDAARFAQLDAAGYYNV